MEGPELLNFDHVLNEHIKKLLIFLLFEKYGTSEGSE